MCVCVASEKTGGGGGLVCQRKQDVWVHGPPNTETTKKRRKNHSNLHNKSSCPNSDGMVPVNRLSPKYNSRKEVYWPTLDEMVPVNKLFRRLRLSKNGKFVYQFLGMVPVNWFPCNLNTSKYFNCPYSSHKVPLKELKVNSKLERYDKYPNSHGKVPVKPNESIQGGVRGFNQQQKTRRRKSALAQTKKGDLYKK